MQLILTDKYYGHKHLRTLGGAVVRSVVRSANNILSKRTLVPDVCIYAGEASFLVRTTRIAACVDHMLQVPKPQRGAF